MLDIYQAVASRYFQDESTTTQYHRELAEHFAMLEGYPERKIEEWCWQLEKAKEYLKCVTQFVSG